MAELTTDHVDVLGQAAVDLCGGQAHLGAAWDRPKSEGSGFSGASTSLFLSISHSFFFFF